MKKLLIATTALVFVAGAASADVTLGGYGRFGIKYDGTNTNVNGTPNKTQLTDRFNLDIKASKTTDSGLTFHGKIRIRENAGDSIGKTGKGISGGQIGVTAGGLDVSVGNVSDAIDAMALYFNSEMGLNAVGGETMDYSGGYVGYSSQGAGNNGVLATYTMGGFTLRGSIQQVSGQVNGAKNETAVSALYKAGSLSVEAGYYDNQSTVTVKNVYGTQVASGKDKGYTLVAEYALGTSTLGLAYGHSDNTKLSTVTLYGSTKLGATTLQAFVSNDSKKMYAGATQTNYGVGASYDLGSGAAMIGSVRKQQQNGKTYADLGVKFAF